MKRLLWGAVLFGVLCQSEYLLIPVWMETPARILYLFAYYAVLPVRGVVLPILPETEHHWSLLHTAVVAFGTPFFYWGFFRFIKRIFPTREPIKKSRRMFLKLLGAGFITYGALVEPRWLKVREYRIRIKNLPQKLDGLRLVHMADTHYGPFTALSQIEAAVDLANSLNPDLVVLTGDYVHRSKKAIEPGIGVFSKLKPKLGTYGVLGNHEHWEGKEECIKAFQSIKVPLLDNTHTLLADQSLCLAGVGDLWEDEVSFEKALSGVSPSTPKILLSHNPDVAEMMEHEHRADLLLAGHTHGGQVRLPRSFRMAHAAVTQYGDKYLGGLCQGPFCPVVVNRGVSLAGFPMRLGVPPEIGLIILSG